MRALEAGSAVGGDARCNNDQLTQTAATAAILVARGTDEPYATENIGQTDAGTANAPWLAISVTESQFGPNPILELRERYDEWRAESTIASDGADIAVNGRGIESVGPLVFIIVVVLTIVFLVIAVARPRRNRPERST